MIIHYCPYCGTEPKPEHKKLEAIYCEKCKAIIRVVVEVGSVDSPLLVREYDNA